MTTMKQLQLHITPRLLVVISFFGLIIADLRGQDVSEDTVCYGTSCNTHRLTCSGNNIAVMSADFAYIENCTCEKSPYRCRTCQSGGKRTELNTALSCKIPYRYDDYWGLVNTCSRKTNCFIYLPEPTADTECSSSDRFSHIKYRCVQKKAEIPFCGGEIQSSRRVSLFFSGSTSPNTSQHCICRITSTSVYSITALDVRFGDAANSTTLRMQYSTNNITHLFKERNVKPNTLLLHTTTKTSAAIHLEMHSNYMPERIWLLVEAGETGNLTIKCESQLPTSHPNIPEENQHVPLLPSIIGGCAACLIVVLGVIMVIRYKRKRRTDPGKVEDKSMVEPKDGNRGSQNLYDIVKEIPENESTQLFTSDHDNLEEESYHYIEAQVSTLKTVSSKECISSYSHLNEIANGYDEVTVARSVKDDTGSNYDTMASASHSVGGLIQEDLDSYDHLGQPFTKAPPEGDYDSTC